MKLLRAIRSKLALFVNWFSGKSIVVKIVVITVIGVLIWLGVKRFRDSKNSQTQYQTAAAKKGTLIVSVSASGNISSTNAAAITTSATGTVNEVYVNNGDIVAKDQKIAIIDLDDEGIERQSQAYIEYLRAKEAVETAKKSKIDADISMWEARQSILDAEEEVEDKNVDPINPDTDEEYTENERAIIDKSVDQAKADFQVAELKYQNADNDVSNAQVLQGAAWRDYKETSSIIYASAAGKLSGLTLSPGVVVSSNDNTAGQNIGKIEYPDGQLQAEVDLSELDATKVKPGQKVTLTLDAYPDNTFTGKVLAVDTSGVSDQGVTSYPATILIDKTSVEIYPNMAVAAQIMLDAKPDVLLIPSSAVQTAKDGSYYVEILKDEEVSRVSVETGESNDTQTIINSGLSEGDVVITAKIDLDQKADSGGISPFGGTSSFGGGKLK